VPRPEPESASIVQGGDGLEHAIEVQERLAHTHEDDVRQVALPCGEAAGRAADLVDDLGRVEVPREAQLPGGAERAADGAAGLARDAQRVPLAASRRGRVVHQHRLDRHAVPQSMKRLFRSPAISQDQVVVDDRVPAERLVHRLAQRRRERRDVGRRAGLGSPDRVLDLASAESRFAALT
jgi:hypothetical protein